MYSPNSLSEQLHACLTDWKRRGLPWSQSSKYRKFFQINCIFIHRFFMHSRGLTQPASKTKKAITKLFGIRHRTAWNISKIIPLSRNSSFKDTACWRWLHRLMWMLPRLFSNQFVKVSQDFTAVPQVFPPPLCVCFSSSWLVVLHRQPRRNQLAKWRGSWRPAMCHPWNSKS